MVNGGFVYGKLKKYQCRSCKQYSNEQILNILPIRDWKEKDLLDLKKKLPFISKRKHWWEISECLY